MSLVISNLEKIIEDKNISPRQFEMSVGMSNGAIGKAIKNNSSIHSRFIESIISEYRINPKWLFLGEGNMYLDDEKTGEFSGELLSENKGNEALLLCKNEVEELEGKLAEKEKEIGYLKEQISDKQEIIYHLKKRLETYEKGENEQNNVRQTG